MTTAFRFELGERVRVLTHPAEPWELVTARWSGEAAGDTYGEHIYAVSGFATLQRESSLAAEGWVPLSLDVLDQWRLAGHGRFHRVGPSTIESDGGPGILWYPRLELADFTLRIDWRLSAPEDNSGVFLRIPSLASDDPQAWRAAVDDGYEVQIDDRGVDPERGVLGSDLHRTGAIYRHAPALARASAPVLDWNTFEIEARGPLIRVRLNGVTACAFEDGAARRRSGHVGLQAHHPGSRVRFRNLQVRPSDVRAFGPRPAPAPLTAERRAA